MLITKCTTIIILVYAFHSANMFLFSVNNIFRESCLMTSASIGPSVFAGAQPLGDQTTVVFVRHAERAAEPADDPPLNPDGRRRAKALAAALRHAEPVAIITSQ